MAKIQSTKLIEILSEIKSTASREIINRGMDAGADECRIDDTVYALGRTIDCVIQVVNTLASEQGED